MTTTVLTTKTPVPTRYDVSTGGGAVYSLVSNGWDSAQEYASQAVSRANEFLRQLQMLADHVADLPRVDDSFGTVDAVIDQFVVPPSPELGPLPDAPLSRIPEFSWVEEVYSSALIDRMKSELLSLLAGPSTGLSVAVEAQIWERARAREHATSAKRIGAAMAQFSGRGWRRPPGALGIEISLALHDERIALSGASREIMVKQSELEQTNRQFAFKTAVDAETMISKYIGDSKSRSLEAAKQTTMIVLETYKTHVESFAQQTKAIVDIFRGRSEVFKAVVEGQSDVMRAQADVYKAKADVVQMQAKTRIDAAKANIEILIEKARMISEVVRAGSQMSAQIASSALSAVNLSGGVSASVGMSASSSDSVSYSQAVSASTSQSVSAVNSSSNSNNHSTSQSSVNSTSNSNSTSNNNSTSSSTVASTSSSTSSNTSNSTSNSAVTSSSTNTSISKNENNNTSTSSNYNYNRGFNISYVYSAKAGNMLSR